MGIYKSLYTFSVSSSDFNKNAIAFLLNYIGTLGASATGKLPAFERLEAFNSRWPGNPYISILHNHPFEG